MTWPLLSLPDVEVLQLDINGYKHHLCFVHNIDYITKKYLYQRITTELTEKLKYELNYYLREHLLKHYRDVQNWEAVIYQEAGSIEISLINKLIPLKTSDYDNCNSEVHSADCIECKETKFERLLK